MSEESIELQKTEKKVKIIDKENEENEEKEENEENEEKSPKEDEDSEAEMPISRTKSSKNLTAAQLAQIEEQRIQELHEEEKHPSHLAMQRRETIFFGVVIMLIELVIILVYGTYGAYPDPSQVNEQLTLYPYFRDVNIMIFFGFGFLMTFLRRYGYSAVGYTLLISSIVVQYSVIVQGVIFNLVAIGQGQPWTTFPVSLDSLINGLFCAGTVMISFGAILGKVSPSHLVILALIEPWFFFANLGVFQVIDALDVGGGMSIHTLGGYFGIVMTYFLTSKETRNHLDNTSNYSGDLFSLAGTLFLWLLWPSFNAAVAPTPMGSVRALINTFLSITSSTFATFVVSRFFSEYKFDVVHIQNSTLAGGVVMGVAADLNVTPAGAVICGFVAGTVSVLGFRFLTPFLSEKLNVQDICGVHNLHAMPGILSGIVGILATIDNNGQTFPKGTNQPAFQTAALFITLGFAFLGGLVTGIILNLFNKFRHIVAINYFNDRTFWHLPSDYYLIINKSQ